MSGPRCDTPAGLRLCERANASIVAPDDGYFVVSAKTVAGAVHTAEFTRAVLARERYEWAIARDQSADLPLYVEVSLYLRLAHHVAED